MNQMRALFKFLVTPEEEVAYPGFYKQPLFRSTVANEAAGLCKFTLWVSVAMVCTAFIGQLQ